MSEIVGAWTLGGHLPLGAGSAGFEARYRHPLGSWGYLEPSIGYDYYVLIGGWGFGAGHGPRAGLDLLFNVEDEHSLGYPTRSSTVGFYVNGGPVFGSDKLGVAMSGGLSISVF